MPPRAKSATGVAESESMFTVLLTISGKARPLAETRTPPAAAQGSGLAAAPRSVVELRRHTIGYVSQFLKTIPRVSTLNLVMEPALERGWSVEQARERAENLLSRLNIPERLWHLAPSTFSGGEQQRVNIARGFMVAWPVLLLDEPTASLDETNRAVVVELMQEAKAGGAAMVGIFHDAEVRQAIGDKQFNVSANEVSSHVQ